MGFEACKLRALGLPATLLLACVLWLDTARANDAEIVSLIGKGDAREAAAADWKPASVKQKLVSGSFVRTREQSQMALLLKDNTQVRLNQQSILNIKSIGGAKQATQLELPQGRAWSQAKSREADVAAGKRPILEVSTPAATATIRGTDWELVVEPDGTSTITVLSGAVDFYNDHGRVAVLPNEQARAVRGKAPVKIFLSTAAERVQWVTSYRPQPRRWVTAPTGAIAAIVKSIEDAEYAPALAALEKDSSLPRLQVSLLLADMKLFLGEPAQALAILGSYANDGNGDPMAAALLARALLISGRISDAARVSANAAGKHANHIEVLLAAGEVARVQGDAVAARGASEKVIAIDPKNAEAWYVIGRIETEREYAKAARDALGRAISLRPDGPGYKGELGTLETFANEFTAADAAFKAALDQVPDDYVALTGLGVLQLKRGEPEAALESFLKSGVIEPRYARAWLFSGVAYYQLGERARALEAFEKAATLDDKDPLPHLMRSLAYYDSLELGRSIEAAREAQVRMPFLKSLNQVLNDQKGNANLGSALAAFGMEEWSQAYAYDSYSPYWAGSHLFLADRFSGTFNKNSELFKGFLSDPSVFGASNRFSSMMPVPGRYGSVEALLKRDLIVETGLTAAANGYSVSRMPLAYSFAADWTTGDSAINSTRLDGRLRARGENYILGLGAKPTHELGLFAFANSTSYDGHIAERASGAIDDNFSIHYRRYDVGLNYKFNPTNHAWLKAGVGSEKQPISGALFSTDLARFLDREVRRIFGQPAGQVLHSPDGRLNALAYDQSQRDLQWRHTFDLTPAAQLSWGLEFAKQDKPVVFDFQFPNLIVGVVADSFRSILNDTTHIGSRTAYLSGRFALVRDLDAQADLFYQDTRLSFERTRQLEFHSDVHRSAFPETGDERNRELNPRLGFKWRPAPGHTVRLAGQVWRKPAGVNTLAPIDTVGIALDDQTVDAGGRLKRARLQHEMQFGTATFAQWFVDWKDIDNQSEGASGIVSDLQLIDLERLRARQRVYAVRQDFLEAKPDFGAGRIGQVGVAVNHLLSRTVSASARYILSKTENTTDDTRFNGLQLPYHPRHYVNLALNWQPFRRVIVSPMATYRSSRYRDEANLERLSDGVAFGLSAFWESEDKRLSVGAVIDHITSDRKSSIYRHPVGQLQATYRF